MNNNAVHIEFCGFHEKSTEPGGVAAADPRLLTGKGASPLVVVLDDSYSMRAGGDDSPRRRAQAALDEMTSVDR